MKNTFKRIAAFALILCMLLSVVPAVALAEETDSTSVKYDFRLNQTDLTFFYTNTNENVGYASINIAEVSNKGRDSRVALAEYYANGDINWKYHEVSESVAKNANFTIAANNEDGTPKVDYGAYIRGRDASGAHVAGSYFAVMIKSPGTGDYKLTLNYYKTKTAAPKGSVYVMPAGVTDIPGAMEYYAPVGSFTNDSTATSFTSTDAEMGTVSMKAGKDYLLVFTMDEVNASGNSYLYIGDVTLDLQAPAQNRDAIEYNFALVDDYSGMSPLKDATVYDGISNKYDAEDLHWKDPYTGNKVNGAATGWQFLFGAASTYDLYLQGSNKTQYCKDVFFAVTVRSPGSGYYQMTLAYQTSTTGAQKGSVYILPGDTAQKDIPALLTADNLIGSFSCKGAKNYEDKSVIFDTPVECDAGEEYLMVFTSDEYYDATVEASKLRANLFISGVALNRAAAAQDEIEYIFDLGDVKDADGNELLGNGITFSGRNFANGTPAANNAAKDLESYYNSKVVDWHYHSSVSNCTFAVVAEGTDYQGLDLHGVRTSGVDTYGDYFAMVIRSPGAGNYKMDLKYWDSKYSAAKGTMYLLPIGTEINASALNANTDGYIGEFTCTGTSAFTEMNTSYDVSLGVAEEYLLVFKNDEPCPVNANRATLYVENIKLTNKAAGGSEEASGDFIADGKSFATFEEAVAAAYDADDLAVKLNADVAMDELIVPANLSIDLNGKTLTVDALSGSVTDSSAGNTGLLAAERDTIVFSAKNADAPLWDAAAGGYRFFDYLLEVYDEAEAVEGKPSSQKFWFKFHFYTDDACTELDQDAYALVAGGNSGFKVATHMSWNGEALPSVYYGIDGDVDAFSRGWATNATASRWLYIRVDGLDEDLNGTLRVKPELEANGVYISNTVVSYVNEAPDTAE